jgi:glycosyltransferase involved in cell wall biosynthesis
MRVCIEAHLLNHARRSGVMTYTEGLVNSLYAHDRENQYALLYYSLRRRAEDMPGPGKDNFTKAVARVPDQMFWGRQSLLDKVFLPAFLKKHKIDIFHRAVGYTLPESKKVFRILTVHDLRTLTIGDRWAAQNVGHYRKVLSAVNLCVVVSECTKRDLMEHFAMPEKKIRVVYLGADKRYKPAPPDQVEAIRKKFRLKGPYFLSVGSVPRKNIDGIIKGFAGCRVKKDYQLVLNGKIDVDKYTRLAEGLGVKDQTVFVKNVSDEDLVALYSGCHCFVFPSLYEGFGLPIVEAMNCGAPVITSNISSCPEVAGDAALLVDPYKIPEISSAMDRMAEDQWLRKTCITKGFERAKLFIWDKFAGQMKTIYSGI